ncbi:uncharacterized protein PG986_005933 [Apiospora aurea]|uniref:Uncharacterized protein n=1 Tax=Apiospora aurea TaxID=335848 RepID=A0ABR1QKC5_9PEZI
MASIPRMWITSDILCEAATHNRKLNPETICDRVEAWKSDMGNVKKLAAITTLSGELARLRDVIIPDYYWQPDLRETLGAQLCAIQSAIDRLGAKSQSDASSFSSVLDEVRAYYSKPAHRPEDLGPDHMEMVLEILTYAIRQCRSGTADDSSYDKPKACYGRVSEALEQAFLFRKRNVPCVSELTEELLNAFKMVHETATAFLFFEMKSERTKKSNRCNSTLGEQPQSPGQSDDDEEDSLAEADRYDGEAKGTLQICACHSVTRKMWQIDHEIAQRKERSLARLKSRDPDSDRARQGHDTKPLNPSPLGQFVEAAD